MTVITWAPIPVMASSHCEYELLTSILQLKTKTIKLHYEVEH